MIKVGLDIGNSKISCIVCDTKKNNYQKILSFVSNPTNSVKKSIITNIEKIKNEINETILYAAQESQTEILSINLNVPAVDSLSLYFDSMINLNNEKINDLHIKKAINQSDFFNLIDNYQVIHNSIINYELDQNSIVSDPRGMFGDKLKINFYKFVIKENFIKTISTIFNHLNIHIENFIPSPLSSALATLTDDDKSLGAICIDFGSSSTSVSVFENEKLIFMNSIKVGGMHITNDLARKFSTTIESAERLKTLYGSVITSPSDEYDIIDIQSTDTENTQSKQINRSSVNAIIKPRVEETLELVWQKLKDYNLHNKQIKNLVITGGGALLEGIEDYAQIIFDSNVRIGKPMILPGLSSKFIKPQFSQTVGTLLYNPADYELDFLLKNREKNKKKSILGRFSSWLDQYI